MAEPENHKTSSLLGSFALHALIVGAVFYLLSLEPEESQNSGPIQIESITDKKTERPHRPKMKVKVPTDRIAKPNPGSHEVSLSDLGMRYSPIREQPLRQERQEYSPPSEVPEDDEWDIMNPDPKIARFNQYIYRTVQGWLDRDAGLNIDPMYGTVKVRIWFDENGNYLEDETNYDAIDPNFRRAVARALHKSFAVPIPRPYLYIHKKFSIERTVVIRKY